MKVVLIPTLPSEFDKVTKSPELIELGERMEEWKNILKCANMEMLF